ncbi:cation:proton antiporter [Roseicyclus sp. F158]|uniref:Cation:proton antiporter n=1 Tax=Tropicimonas omnivorans TaxID=3075590 RepID=A0ABU3DDW9_9RHOB|nr:cation:proton antiporter [Roseicyclus sp. F158]MDT0681920.1 cation:proton antiporter [Roseicyclus sp. F158]
MEFILAQATLYLAAAVVAVPICARLGLGSVLGYLLAGIAIQPFIGMLGTEAGELMHFAEFGVVLMLFLIGLELEPRALWDMRHKLVGLGGMQVLLTTFVIAGGCLILGVPVPTAIAIGMTLALSSTAIVLQTLTEKGLMKTPGGHASFSVLLTQDVAVIPFLAILPLLTMPGISARISETGTIERAGDGDHEAALSLVSGLPGWQVTLVTLGAVALVILVGIYATRPVFRFIHMAKLREMYTATALLMVVGIAVLMNAVGLSAALGTFLAGVVLANSEFRHELEADIEPFKGLLLGLFFIAVGADINFQYLWRNLGDVIGLTLLVVLAKGVILLGLATAFRLKGEDRLLFTLGLAQAGEFGFVLVSFSLQQGVFDPALGQLLLLVVALSMLMTPLFFIAQDQIARRLSGGRNSAQHDHIDEQGAVIIAGIGRFGQVVNRMVQMAGLTTTVIDNDLPTIQLMRKFGFKGFFGDPTRPEIIHAAGLANARILVVALDDKAAALKLVRHARAHRPDLHIVARAHDRVHVYELYRAGANDIVREMFDSSLRAGRYVLENMSFSEFEAHEIERTFYTHDRRTIRELADVWRPGVPVAENAEYIARARELNKDLETALVTALDDSEDARDAARRDRDAEAAAVAKSETRKMEGQ